MPSFKSDLQQERILAEYLDGVYSAKGWDFKRITNTEKQKQGVDLEIKHGGKVYSIDEKAQLHYLNSDLPTFTFELSFLDSKNNPSVGWLLDDKKKTDYFFLITSIQTFDKKERLDSVLDISSIKITSVNHKKLLYHLDAMGLEKEMLLEYDLILRDNLSYGKNAIAELDAKKQGLIYFSQHLNERPMNLQLRLQFLIESGVAKCL
ncbi:MAG: hypothetical protein AAF688_06720 [Bacteroidota bacterium]